MLNREKEYYSLAEIETMVDLKTRSVKYRMLTVKKKYKNNPQLLFKGKKKWNIHKSIIFEFDRKQLSKSEKELTYNSLVTISPDGNYDIEALKEALNLVKAQINIINNNANLYYFIEQGERSKLNHIHFMTNLTPKFEKKMYRIVNIYLKANVDVRWIYEERQLLEYLQKDIKAQGKLD